MTFLICEASETQLAPHLMKVAKTRSHTSKPRLRLRKPQLSTWDIEIHIQNANQLPDRVGWGTRALTQGAHGVYLGTPAQGLPPLTVVVESAVTVTSLHAGGGWQNWGWEVKQSARGGTVRSWADPFLCCHGSHVWMSLPAALWCPEVPDERWSHVSP